MADAVLQQEHLGQSVLGGEQGGGARAAVLLAAAQDLLDQGLVLVLHGGQAGGLALDLDGKQVAVVEHRADAVLIDLVLRSSQTAVAQQVSQSQLTVQLQAHLLLQPCHNVKAGNVDHVVAVQLLLLVHGGGAGGAAQQAKDLFLLEVALEVTLGAGILLGQVSKHALEPAEGNVVHSAHDHTHPVVGLVDDAGRGVQQVILREQPVDVVDAVGQLVTVHAGILKGSLHGAVALCGLDHVVDLFDAVLQHSCVGILVENILLHGIVLLTVIVVAAFLLFQGQAHQSVAALFLLIGHAVVDLFERLAFVLFIRHFGFLLCCFIVGHGIAAVRTVCKVFQRVALGVHAVGQAQAVLVIDKGLAALVVLIGAVLHHLVDQGTRVASGQHQAHFPDKAVLHGAAHLLQAIGKDGKGAQVAALHALSCGLAGVGVVEFGIAVHAAGPVFQQAVADHVVHVGVVVVVHHGHNLAAALLKGILRDHQPVIAPDVRFRRPAAAIVVKINHFDLQYSSLRHPALP